MKRKFSQFVVLSIFCSLINFGCSKDNSTEVITKSLNFKDIKKINTTVSNDLLDVAFFDSQTGYIVGDSGLILKTTDEGESWVKLNSYVSNRLYCLTLHGSDIFVGGVDLLLKSSNNGTTWSRTDTIYTDIHDIAFNNDGMCIAVGGNGSFNGNVNAIYVTGGYDDNWSKQNIRYGYGILYSVLFLNDSSIILASAYCINLGSPCDVGIYKSTGGLNNYKLTYGLKGLVGFHSLSSPDGNSIIAVGTGGRIIYSSDAGENWIDKKSEYNNTLHSVASYSKDNYYVVGDSGLIISTSNNGQNYTRLNTNNINALGAICFPSQHYGIVVGANGTILKLTFE